MQSPILYGVNGTVATITFNRPRQLNSLNNDHYILLGKLMERADRDPNTTVTIIQLTGRFFSAGADIVDKDTTLSSPEDPHKHWLQNFVARNVYLADCFHNHTKVLVAALNGPVFGFTAALVLLCDLVYANGLDNVYLSAPFAAHGVVAEGAASATFFMRLGWSKASEALLLCKKISCKELVDVGVINDIFDGTQSVPEFNEAVRKRLLDSTKDLYRPSILEMKQLLKANRDTQVNAANSKEVIKTMNSFVDGVPQLRFAKLMAKLKL